MKIIYPKGTLFELNELQMRNPNSALMMTRTNPSGIAFDGLSKRRRDLKGSLLLLEDLTSDITDFGVFHAFEHLKRIEAMAVFNTGEIVIGFIDCKQIHCFCKGFKCNVKGINYY